MAPRSRPGFRSRPGLAASSWSSLASSVFGDMPRSGRRRTTDEPSGIERRARGSLPKVRSCKMYSAEELRQDARLYKGELFLQLGFAAPTRAEGETTQVGTTRGSAPAGLSVDAPDAPPSASPAVV